MGNKTIYINCVEKDLPRIKPLIQRLEAMGFRVFFDDGSTAGNSWPEQTAKALTDCDCVVAFISADSLKPPNFSRELTFARMKGKNLVTVCLEDVPLPPGMRMQLFGGTMIRPGADTEQIAQQIRDSFGPEDPMFMARRAPEPVGEPERQREREQRQMDELLREFGFPEPTPSNAVPTPPIPPASQASEPWFHVESPRGYVSEDPCKEIVPPMPPAANMAPPPPLAQAPCDPPAAKSAGGFTPPTTGKKPSLSERVKMLFHKTSMVGFSALAPAVFPLGEYTMVDIYAYEDEFRQVVDRAVAEKGLTETDGGRLQVRKGTQITIILSSPDVEIIDNTESQVWTGQYAKFDFPVFVPENYTKKQILFQAAVYFDGIIATHIRFLAQCRSLVRQELTPDMEPVRSAFISYASADRSRVSMILQGMRKSRPDMDIFFDVETLRSGDNWRNQLEKEIDARDVLFLCWSKAAKESQWVDFEWKRAYQNKGPKGVEPIPLERPDECPPPPEELKDKHFNARELYYR